MGWSWLFLLVLTPLLTWTNARDLYALISHHGSRLEIALALIVSAATLFCWHQLCSKLMPWLILGHRVRAAYRSSDWLTLRSLLQAADRRGWMSNAWRATLGLANLNLESFDEAIAWYERVEDRLPDPELEYARIHNHACCLIHLARISEARMVFESVPAEEWPGPMLGHVLWLRTHVEDDASPPETVY